MDISYLFEQLGDAFEAPTDRPIEKLSFARKGSAWQPESAGSYTDDCARGRSYARELIAFMRAHDNPTVLGHVCRAIAARELSGIEVGFFHEISCTMIAVSLDNVVAMPTPVGRIDRSEAL